MGNYVGSLYIRAPKSEPVVLNVLSLAKESKGVQKPFPLLNFFNGAMNSLNRQPSVSPNFASLFSFISSFSFKKYTSEICPKDFKSLKSEPEWDAVGFKVSEAKTDEVGFMESEDDCEGKKLAFRFPSFEEFSKSKKENNQLFN
ncbi:hypothetical protein ACH5RR_011176 [Cinchona calisaya]|uniref:Uncharacterized protein n=1 Tax=Cinchona calisaya TaxID=153742 RepID=A0ABD3A446_9GENT